MSQTYNVYQITPQNLSENVNFACKYYINEQVMSHLGATQQQCKSDYKEVFQQCSTEGIGLSYGLKYKQQIVGVLFGMSYKCYSHNVQEPCYLSPFHALMETNQKINLGNINQSEIFSIFLVVTHPDYRNQGICCMLLKYTQKQAKSGFMYMQADCTNRCSEKAFLKSGYQILRTTEYDKFQFKGLHPFKNVKGSDFCSYVLKRIQ